MSERLRFEIGVDFAPLDKALNEAGKEIKQFTDANKRNFERTGLQVASIGASIVAMAQDVGGFASQIKDVFAGIAKSIEEGDIPTLIGLVTSAIGVFIGLIPTIVSGIALIRTAFASLSLTLTANPIGAVVAAIGLAVLGVIAIFKLFSSEVEKFKAKRDLLNEVNMGAVKALAKEKAELTSLLAIAKDITVPYSQRLKAVKKLNEISPEYLGNITLENLETRKTVEAINLYNEAIVKKAKAQAANKLLSENIEKQLVIELNATKKSTREQNNATLARIKQTMSEETWLKVKDDLARNLNTLNTIQENQLKVLKQEEAEILKLIQAYEGYDIQLKKTAKIKDTPQVQPLQTNLQPSGLQALPGGAMELPDLSAYRATLDSEFLAIQLRMIEFNNQVNEIINNSITNTFMNLGDAIGNALATGGNVMKAVGDTLVKAVGSFLGQLGKQMILFGTTALFFDKTKKALFTGIGTPAAAAGLIAAGIALSAIGSAISGASSGGLIGGGSSGSYSGGGSFSSGSNVSSSSFSAQRNDEVVFRIAGTDLLGVLRRAENAENRI